MYELYFCIILLYHSKVDQLLFFFFFLNTRRCDFFFPRKPKEQDCATSYYPRVVSNYSHSYRSSLPRDAKRRDEG